MIGLLKVFARAGHAQRSVLHAFDGFQQVGEGLDVLRLAFDRDDLQAIMVVDVDVLGGDDLVEVVVLDVHEPVHEIALVVVVDHGDGPGDFMTGLPVGFHQRLADEIADRLRPVGVMLGLDMFVEPVGQFFLEGNAEPNDLGHRLASVARLPE